MAATVALQLACCGQQDAGPGHSEGMAQGDGAPLRIDARVVVGQPERSGTGQALGGKGLIQLDVVHVLEGQSGLVEGLSGGLHRADAHDAGLDADHGAGDNLGQRGEPVSLHARLVGEKQGAGPIVEATAVAGCDTTSLLSESGSELGQDVRG